MHARHLCQWDARLPYEPQCGDEQKQRMSTSTRSLRLHGVEVITIPGNSRYIMDKSQNTPVLLMNTAGTKTT
jgi:hypothetical protein